MKKQWLATLALVSALFAQDALAQEPRFPQFPRDVHGLWYQPIDPGWATAVFDHSTAMSAVLMVHDFEGKPTWAYASTLDCYREGAAGLNANCLGPMYKVTGNWFGEPFRQDQVRQEIVGDWEGWWGHPLFASVGPNQSRDLFLTYTLFNRKVSPFADQPMKILPIDPLEPYLYYNTGQSGLYVAQNEAGWGVGLFQQGMRLVATLFIHDRNREPRWYYVQMETRQFILPYETDPGRLFEGDVYETRGHYYGVYSLEPYSARRVGGASVKFDGALNPTATLKYSIDGVQVTKTVFRIAK